MEESQLVQDEYKEKKWGKVEGEDYIVDGYVFRGKKNFNKALEGIKDVLKRGVVNEIGNIKFTALDVRKRGYEFEIDVEIIDNGDRGVGKVKLYGPNNKKENVITITKSKESEHKYVTTLAEKIIKPLMKTFLLGPESPLKFKC